ncbi:MAG: DUF6288 domain-containing protein [Verrucomicrobia bacterium]|nr:DUF6288 domain-containing protein [Verrucomicrobiota bacterium]
MKKIILRSSALLTLGVLFQLAGPVLAAPPDATQDYIDATFTYNLGPTGARGWIYSTGNEWMFVPEGLTSESRQIKITAVDKGSPADGVLFVDDVIMGIGAGVFTEDARKSLGVAIGEAEKAEHQGQLKLKIWRQGTLHDNVTVPLAVMGAYSATAPYDCPKSALILTNACKYLETHATFNAGNEGNAVVGLALLAAGRPTDLPKVQAYARKVAAGVGKLTVPLNEMCAWPWGYNNTFLCEYYLATGDQEVLRAINEYTITSARGQSWCGTYGHGMAWPKPDGSSTHGIVPPYGALNQAGLLVSIGIVLGDKCGIKDPEIAPAIENDKNSPPKLNYFKTIESASVAPEVFTKPVVTTRLKASATSIAGNPLIYTWRKVRGAGPVTFSPNGTSDSSNSTAAFTIPGTYILKLTVSDALLGDTEGYGGCPPI